MKNLSLKQRRRILDKVSRLVEKKHFNPELKVADWRTLVATRSDQILNAADAEQFEREIQSLVSGLRSSHTGFFHKSGRIVPARHAINATFKACEIEGRECWIFQDVHEGGAASVAGLQPGDALLAINGELVKPPVQPVFRMANQAELTVRKRDERVVSVPVATPTPISRKRPIAEPRALSVSKAGSERTGYIKITIFPGAVGIDIAAEIDRAITQIADGDRLIVDLRGNTGGGIGGLRLMSYLTPDKIPVGYSLTRRREQKGFKKENLVRVGKIPSRKIALLWLMLRYGIVDQSICLLTEGLGQQKFHGRVVLLVNEHTASAAEMIAAFVKENRLGTIVGTRTAGRLLSGRAFHVGGGYVLSLPVAAYFTWNGALLEGTGVLPDIDADLKCAALRAGLDTQLQKAVELVESL